MTHQGYDHEERKDNYHYKPMGKAITDEEYQKIKADNPNGVEDEDGFFIFPDGSFIDPDGYQFDKDGYDEFGGYYDDYGYYVPAED